MELYRLPAIPRAWSTLDAAAKTPGFAGLRDFLDGDARTHEIYPPARDVYHALSLTPLRAVRVLLLGQDPYPGVGQAHGLAFSVRPGMKPPASLRNMLKELHSDIGCEIAADGNLEPWARRGVLLLNAVLTVRAGEPNSHRGHGWETFTDDIIRRVNDRKIPVVFALWGAYAQKKIPLIDTTRHAIVTAAHPSPLSAHNGFFGTRPFSRINDALEERGRQPIDWQLPADR